MVLARMVWWKHFVAIDATSIHKRHVRWKTFIWLVFRIWSICVCVCFTLKKQICICEPVYTLCKNHIYHYFGMRFILACDVFAAKLFTLNIRRYFKLWHQMLHCINGSIGVDRKGERERERERGGGGEREIDWKRNAI